MKFKSSVYQPLLALMLTSGLLHAQGSITIPPAATPVTIQGNTLIEGTVTVQAPASTPVAVGTAALSSLPIGNELNIGYNDPSTVGQFSSSSLSGNAVYQYSNNGSGTQTLASQTNGGVTVTTSGNVTLNETAVATTTYNYTIESRQILVSNPAGFTDTAGTYGVSGTFYANGTTLPGSQENVATLRDEDGELVSVLSDLSGVGAVTTTDASGNFILSAAQINNAVSAGAPASFVTIGESVVSSGTGNLVVQGSSTLGNSLTDTTNVSGRLIVAGGLNNGNQVISGVASGVLPNDAANVSQVNAVRNSYMAADTSIRNDFAAADNIERNARIAGDNRLQNNIDENTRGIAMVAAMTSTTVAQGKTHGVDFNVAQFQSETGFAFGYANRINDNVQVSTSVASTNDLSDNVARIGVSFQW